jgi:hypothetical protein
MPVLIVTVVAVHGPLGAAQSTFAVFATGSGPQLRVTAEAEAAESATSAHTSPTRPPFVTAIDDVRMVGGVLSRGMATGAFGSAPRDYASTRGSWSTEIGKLKISGSRCVATSPAVCVGDVRARRAARVDPPAATP